VAFLGAEQGFVELRKRDAMGKALVDRMIKARRKKEVSTSNMMIAWALTVHLQVSNNKVQHRERKRVALPFPTPWEGRGI
jgi:hypothetical protein